MKLSAVVASALLCASASALAQQPASSPEVTPEGDNRSMSASPATQDAQHTDRDGKVAGQRVADASGHSGMHVTSPEFAKKAAAAGLAEVEMGQLGSKKATNPEVKAFAQKMVTDHTAANKELMAAAKKKNLETPTSPDLMHKGMMEKFEAQKADADFDEDFMEQMVRDHEKAVELYQAASNDTQIDPELRALAKKTLPTLQQHLADAKRIEQKLDKND